VLYVDLDLDLAGQISKRIPTRVGRSLLAGALSKIQILTAAGAKPFAVFFAEGATRQGEQHLLAHDILKQKTALLIIPYFRLIFSNCVLTEERIGTHRAEDKVEIADEGGGNRVDAACTQDFEVAGVLGADADIVDVGIGAAVLDKKVCLTFHGKRAHLLDVGSVIEGTGSDGLLKFEGLIYELERGNQHIIKGSRLEVEVKSESRNAVALLGERGSIWLASRRWPGCLR
jgi:hypothetical protein